MQRIRPRPRFWRLLILVMVFFILCSCVAGECRIRRNRRQLENVCAEKTSMEAYICRLEDRLAYTRTDAYVQRIAREELNMIFPGDIRYVLGE